jgi:hypothetical protein
MRRSHRIRSIVRSTSLASARLPLEAVATAWPLRDKTWTRALAMPGSSAMTGIAAVHVGLRDRTPSLGESGRALPPRHDSQFYREDGPLSGMALDAQRAPVPLNDGAAERDSGECLCCAAALPWRHWHKHCSSLCCE